MHFLKTQNEYQIKQSSDIISVADIKQRLRVHHDKDDALIANLINSVINIAEKVSQIKILPAALNVSMPFSKKGIVNLPAKPILQINEISYINHSGAKIILNENDFYIEGGDLYIKTSIQQKVNLFIRYDLGFAEKIMVPAAFILAAQEYICCLYDNPGMMPEIMGKFLPLISMSLKE